MTPRRMLLMAAGTLAGLALSLVVLLAFPPGRPSPRPGEQFLLPAPIPAQAFELTAHTGRPAQLGLLGRDRLLALFFGYTHCPDVCPLTMTNLARARALLGEDSVDVLPVLITVDPARDGVAALAAYVGRFPGGVIGLTGSEEELTRVAKAWMVHAERAAPDPPPAGPPVSAHAHDPEHYLIDHTARVFVVQDGQIEMTFPPGTSAQDMADGFALLLR